MLNRSQKMPNRMQMKDMAGPLVLGVVMLVLSFSPTGSAYAQAAQRPYPNMAPLDQYRVASQTDEIALARSAAPASISGDADVLTLGAHGYDTAVKGKNGFVCIVERAWANNFGDAEFWNPKHRAPICFNAASARSVLPSYLKRTEWLLAGASEAQMAERTKAAIAAKEIAEPETGAMCYMLSKAGYLGDKAGHWHPHLMFFVPRTTSAAWGADLPGVPVMSDSSGLEPVTTFFVLSPRWSDGSPATMAM